MTDSESWTCHFTSPKTHFPLLLLSAFSLSLTFFKFGPSGMISVLVRLLTWQGFLNFGFLWAPFCTWQRMLPTYLCMLVVSRLVSSVSGWGHQSCSCLQSHPYLRQNWVVFGFAVSWLTYHLLWVCEWCVRVSESAWKGSDVSYPN